MDIISMLKNIDEQLEKINQTEIQERDIQKDNSTKNDNQTINIWDSNNAKYCTFLKTYEELINYIKETKSTDIFIKQTQTNNDPSTSQLDYTAKKSNISLTYTDSNHPVTIVKLFNDEPAEIIINPSFFETIKDKFKIDLTIIIKEIIKTSPQYINIPDSIITDELINDIIVSQTLYKSYINIYQLTNIELSNEQLNKLKQSHLQIYLKNKEISSNKAIGFKTYKELETCTDLTLDDNINIHEIENFIYINPKSIIKIEPYNNFAIDELIYLNNLKKIFEILSTHKRQYNIQIKIENRELLRQSGLLNYKNINLIIYNDLYEYPKEEYLQEEEILNKLIKPVKEANLSPYEKYLAIYNIVKQFKPYKENKENPKDARSLRYILNNDYIVCVGYATLLQTLLNKAEIPSMKISVDVDTSKETDQTTNIVGHARNIIKIDDDKYNIHGIYVVDATWDNDMEQDLYNNSTMTFDRKKEAKRLETLQEEDLLLDFHSINEFSEKMNFYIQRKIKTEFPQEYNKKVVNSYIKTYNKIMEILMKLDYQKYLEFYNKYQPLIQSKVYSVTGLIKFNSLKEVEELFSNFLTEYATYIIPLSNNKVDNNTLINAARNIKLSIDKYDEKKLEEWEKETKEILELKNEKNFPYIYNPNNPVPNYLAERHEEQTKKR